MDHDNASLAARLNSVPVTVEELIAASHEVHRLPLDKRDWRGRMICVARLFEGQEYKAFAVHSRLQAVAAIITGGRLPAALVAETSEGARLIAEPIFTVAAQEPMLFLGQQPTFNTESFIQAVLRHIGAEGHG